MIVEQTAVSKNHKLVLNNRKNGLVTGVLDVLSFNLNEILLERTGDADGKRDGSACEPGKSGKR